MTNEGSEASMELAEESAEKKLLEECISPLKAQLEKSGAPYVPVSSSSGISLLRCSCILIPALARPLYKTTLDNLIDITSKRAEEYITGTAATTKGTQKFDASVKIRASIAGGTH